MLYANAARYIRVRILYGFYGIYAEIPDMIAFISPFQVLCLVLSVLRPLPCGVIMKLTRNVTRSSNKDSTLVKHAER